LLPLFAKRFGARLARTEPLPAQARSIPQETTIEENKLAIRLLKEAGMVPRTIHHGSGNETRQTIEETYKLAQDWKPTWPTGHVHPWPFAELFENSESGWKFATTRNTLRDTDHPADEMTREQC